MYILSYYTGHTATAALLKDGQIIAAVSEERFTNQKNYLGFPKQSIEWCLNFAKIESNDLDLIVRCGLYGAPIHTADKSHKTLSLLAGLYQLVGWLRQAWRRLTYYLPALRPIGRLVYKIATSTIGRYTVNKEKQFVCQWLKIPETKFRAYDHHLLHAATAYYASPFNQEKTLVLTLDAEGDHNCATVNIFEKDHWTRLAASSRENSLGWLFLYVTQYLGMKPMEHEYKVMGLAPYAKAEHVNKVYDKIKDIVSLDPKNPLQFKAKFSLYDSLFYLRQTMSGFRFDNIAGAFQLLLESRMEEWVKSAIKITGLSTVAFAGGAFMNVKANQKIVGLAELKKAFFMPSAGDESLPLGGCFVGYLELSKESNNATPIKPITDLYWGPAVSNDQVKKFLESNKYAHKCRVKHEPNIEKVVAKLLAEGKIVARLKGRGEWGARALGNRSILADPRNPDAVRVINEKLKNRDFWMPFAPSILEDRMTDYCQINKGIISPYMTLSFATTPLGQQDLKAAMHPYDFTVRAQTVIQAWNPKYYELIKEFERLTGVGAVLNTSFNLHGFPIVNGPKEALEAFRNSGLEYLALEDYLISKN